MKLENEVASLKPSKKLKKLGVKQESYFVWCREKLPVEGWSPFELFESREFPPRIEDDYESYSAFTVAELGEMLPADIDYDWLCISKTVDGWFVEYQDMAVVKEAKTEANSRAKMLIYLKENKLLK